MTDGPAHGLTVCLLAPDGAGKSTLCAALAERFPRPVEVIYMGLYSRDARELPVPGLRLLQRIGRQWRGYLRGRGVRRRGGVAVFDRYAYDALLPAARPPSALGRIRRAVLGRMLPAPDLAIVLDAPAEVLHARSGEHSPPELERQRAAYVALAPRLPCRAVVVDADRAADAVPADVSDELWRAMGGRA